MLRVENNKNDNIMDAYSTTLLISLMKKTNLDQYVCFGINCPFCSKKCLEVFDANKRNIHSSFCQHWFGIGRSGNGLFLSDADIERYRQNGITLAVRPDGSIRVDGKIVREADE